LNPIIKNIINLILNLLGEALGAIGNTSVIPILNEYSKDSIIEVAETCELALNRLKWIENDKINEENLSENPFASIDPAPPALIKDISILTKVLLNENASLFDRYRAMFSLRNLQTKESTLALIKG
jgi:deoxyhypusine monooxygenase